MPNVHLTEQMATYVQGQIQSGTYANVSEVVRSGIRMLMERDGARQFYALKTDLEEAVREAENWRVRRIRSLELRARRRPEIAVPI